MMKILKKSNIYLIIYDKLNNREFYKYFLTEYDKDKFKRKLKFSNKLEVVGDSKNDNMYYN